MQSPFIIYFSCSFSEQENIFANTGVYSIQAPFQISSAIYISHHCNQSSDSRLVFHTYKEMTPARLIGNHALVRKETVAVTRMTFCRIMVGAFYYSRFSRLYDKHSELWIQETTEPLRLAPELSNVWQLFACCSVISHISGIFLAWLPIFLLLFLVTEIKVLPANFHVFFMTFSSQKCPVKPKWINQQRARHCNESLYKKLCN